MRDPSNFRQHFKEYKEGKSVREIYGLPEYTNGKFSATTKKKIDYYFGKLVANGYDPVSAAGILGNMMQESSLDPDSTNALGYSGLLQNSKAIQQAIINQYGDYSEQSQLRYLSDWTDGSTWIRKGPYAKDTALYSKSYLRKGYKTPEEAAYQFLKRYERAIVVDPKTKKPLRDASGNYIYQDKDKRLRYARDIYDYVIGGKPLEQQIVEVGNTQPELIVTTPVSTRVTTTIPQEKAIPIIDPRNATIAEAQRAMWAHTAFENMPKVLDMPIWESPSLPALTPVEYDVTPIKTYAGGKVADYNEPVITQGRAGSRLDKVDRMMDPDEDDDTKTRVVKRVGKGFTSFVKDAKEWLGLETADRFATHTQRPSDYVDATLIAAGNIMISKMLNSSAKAFIKQYVRSFDDMDARALGEYFFREHPELMTKPQEAWYEELAKKQNSYFLQAIHRRSKAFQKEGVTVNPESISSQLRPEIKIAHLGEKNKYGGIYSASDNTMLVNADRVKDPRTAMRVTGHEDAHAMQSLFEDVTGRPYPTRYGAEMEGLFPFTAKQKAKRTGVHIGKEIDASLHEGKMMRYYDTNNLGKVLDRDFKNMSDEEYKEYMNNGYFKDIMENIQSDLDAQKKFMSKLKDGKLPGYSNGKIRIKPSKRGTFTAAAKKHGASVREFESRVLKNPEKYSTAMVKKARFSRNARSWKH